MVVTDTTAMVAEIHGRMRGSTSAGAIRAVAMREMPMRGLKEMGRLHSLF